MFDGLCEAWNQGDVKGLGEIIEREFAEYPRIYDVFVTQRNKRWLPILDRLLTEGKTALVVVGTGHLVGKHSLVDMLKAKG